LYIGTATKGHLDVELVANRHRRHINIARSVWRDCYVWDALNHCIPMRTCKNAITVTFFATVVLILQIEVKTVYNNIILAGRTH